MKNQQLHLHTWGSKLRRRDGLFEVIVVNKQKKTIKREEVAAARVDRIRLSEGSTVSVDAIRLALEQDVDIVFQDKYGHPIGAVRSAEPGSTTLVQKAQLRATLDDTGLHIARDWLLRKLQAQQALLALVELPAEKQARLEALLRKVAAWQPADGDRASLRGWEGSAGRLYFGTLGGALPKRYRFAQRSRRPARDRFNALLNYGYGVLYTEVERCLLRAGLSPYIGFLHRDGYRFKSLVFDFIEPYRHTVDRTVWKLCTNRKLDYHDFTETADGWLIGPRARKQLLDKLDRELRVQKTRYEGRKETLLQIMQLEAYALAKRLRHTYENA